MLFVEVIFFFLKNLRTKLCSKSKSVWYKSLSYYIQLFSPRRAYQLCLFNLFFKILPWLFYFWPSVWMVLFLQLNACYWTVVLLFLFTNLDHNHNVSFVESFSIQYYISHGWGLIRKHLLTQKFDIFNFWWSIFGTGGGNGFILMY